MTVAATDTHIYDLLTSAFGDDIKVSAGVQVPDDDGKFEQASAVYQRVGADSIPTLDNGSTPHALVYNVVLLNETQALVTDMEDTLRAHIASAQPDAEMFGGADAPPQTEDEGFMRVVALRVPLRSA